MIKQIKTNLRVGHIIQTTVNGELYTGLVYDLGTTHFFFKEYPVKENNDTEWCLRYEETEKEDFTIIGYEPYHPILHPEIEEVEEPKKHKKYSGVMTMAEVTRAVLALREDSVEKVRVVMWDSNHKMIHNIIEFCVNNENIITKSGKLANYIAKHIKPYVAKKNTAFGPIDIEVVVKERFDRD